MTTQIRQTRKKAHHSRPAQLREVFGIGEDVKALREVKKFLSVLTESLDVNVKLTDQMDTVKGILEKIKGSYPHVDDKGFRVIQTFMTKDHAARRTRLKKNLSAALPDRENLPQALPTRVSPSPSPSKAHPVSPLPTNVSQVEEVESFLQACTPPMGHLLQRLLSYGCRNRQFLLAASHWPKEEIEVLLQNLPTLGGRELTQMEVQVLRLHFSQYFNV